MRKISKYDLDRAEIDFDGLRREKEKERAGNALEKKEDMDKELEAQSKAAVVRKDAKIVALTTTKAQQDKERAEMVRKNGEMLRQVIEQKK